MICNCRYSVRFEDVTTSRTKVKYLTDGMLLREAIIDPLLKKYSIVILDEAHERTVSTDVLFGIVKLAQKERNEQKLTPMKVSIISTTLNSYSLGKHGIFGFCICNVYKYLLHSVVSFSIGFLSLSIN